LAECGAVEDIKDAGGGVISEVATRLGSPAGVRLAVMACRWERCRDGSWLGKLRRVGELALCVCVSCDVGELLGGGKGWLDGTVVMAGC
jgi:hypothetical protein